MNQDQSVSLQLSIEELNTILSALGSLPYIQVFELIPKLQQQAGSQLQQKSIPLNGDVEAEKTTISK